MSLGVIGALLKEDDTNIINFLLSNEIIPVFANNGDRKRTVKDGGNFYCLKNTLG